MFWVMQCRKSAYMSFGCSCMAFCALLPAATIHTPKRGQERFDGKKCLGWVEGFSGPVDGNMLNTMAGHGRAVWIGLAIVLLDTLGCKQPFSC
jgi:hypothetical protein